MRERKKTLQKTQQKLLADGKQTDGKHAGIFCPIWEQVLCCSRRVCTLFTLSGRNLLRQ